MSLTFSSVLLRAFTDHSISFQVTKSTSVSNISFQGKTVELKALYLTLPNSPMRLLATMEDIVTLHLVLSVLPEKTV